MALCYLVKPKMVQLHSIFIYRCNFGLPTHLHAVQFNRLIATRRIGMRCTAVISVLVLVMFSLVYPPASFAEGPMVKPETVGFSSERLQRLVWF
jgi:hypothetical protein